MSGDIDLTKAVETAARQWFENAQAIEGWSDISWDDLSPDEQEQMTTPSRWVLNAAAPLIAAQVRAHIAADIDAEKAVPPYSVGDRTFNSAIRRAALIARGDA